MDARESSFPWNSLPSLFDPRPCRLQSRKFLLFPPPPSPPLPLPPPAHLVKFVRLEGGSFASPYFFLLSANPPTQR